MILSILSIVIRYKLVEEEAPNNQAGIIYGPFLVERWQIMHDGTSEGFDLALAEAKEQQKKKLSRRLRSAKPEPITIAHFFISHRDDFDEAALEAERVTLQNSLASLWAD